MLPGAALWLIAAPRTATDCSPQPARGKRSLLNFVLSNSTWVQGALSVEFKNRLIHWQKLSRPPLRSKRQTGRYLPEMRFGCPSWTSIEPSASFHGLLSVCGWNR